MFDFLKKKLFTAFFVLFSLICLFPEANSASKEDIDGMDLNRGVRFLFPRSTVSHPLVMDHKVGLPYVQTLGGEQAYLDGVEGVMMPYKNSQDCCIFKPREPNLSSVASVSSGRSSPKDRSPFPRAASSEHRGFIGNLTKSKGGRSRGVTFSHLSTTLSQSVHGGGIPAHFSERKAYPQHSEEGTESLSKNQSTPVKVGEPSNEGLPKSSSIEDLSAPNLSSGQVAFYLGSSRSEELLPEVILKVGEALNEAPPKSTRALSTASFSPESYSPGNLGEKILTPSVSPWSSIAHLKLTLDDMDGNSIRTYVGTGFVIDVSDLAGSIQDRTGTAIPKNLYLLSAAHNLYLRAYKTGISHIEIYPGLSSEMPVIKKFKADLYIVHPAYVEDTTDSYKEFDFAVIKVPEPFDDSIAKMPIKIFSREDLEKTLIEIWGYPAMIHEKIDGSATPILTSLNSKVMYNMRGEILKVADRQLFYNASTYPGQSGSPIIKGGSVCGIHTYGAKTVEDGNCGTRISSATVDLLWHWIQTLEEESVSGDGHQDNPEDDLEDQ